MAFIAAYLDLAPLYLSGIACKQAGLYHQGSSCSTVPSVDSWCRLISPCKGLGLRLARLRVQVQLKLSLVNSWCRLINPL